MSAGTSATSVTPVVFCTVIEVTALIPHTPSRANVFRSAWMPAPPPESEPAMVSARGTTGSLTEVIPTTRFQRSLRSVGVDGDQAATLADLPDLGELGTEALRE